MKNLTELYGPIMYLKDPNTGEVEEVETKYVQELYDIGRITEDSLADTFKPVREN